jgi:DNA-binding winged helix-turn-helix (wHTH) protein/tetratricopeptide (TPR) repeat protein
VYFVERVTEQTIFRFGPFELDPWAGELRRAGVKLRVQDQPLRLLELLVQRPGSLVTREEMRRRLWPGETFVDFDNSINNTINRLRAVLGDDASSPRYVETVGRRGYRFIAAVEPTAAPAFAGDPDRVQSAASTDGPPSAPAAAAVQDAPATFPPMRLAVLPFRVLRADSDLAFLATSLPEAVAASLAGLESLAVRSPLAAAHLASESPDPAAVAAALDVNLMLTGSILSDGDRLRLSTQLIEIPRGTLVWSLTSHSSLDSIFDIQDRLTTRIVESLAVPLNAREHRLLHHDVPAAGRGYALYLRANQASRNPATWDTARALYLESVGADPDYAPAWARLGRVYRLIGKYNAAEARTCHALAEEAFLHALAISPELSLAHRLYAELEYETSRIPAAIRRLVGRAREHVADAHLFAALVSACRLGGLVDASVAAHQRARQLDPQIRTGIAHTLGAMADYPAALRESRREEDPTLPFVLTQLGRMQEALDAIRVVEARVSSQPDFVAFARGVRLCLEGRRSEGVRELRALAASDLPDAEAWIYLAEIQAWAGEPGDALRSLERAVAGGFACVTWLERDGLLESVRALPAFSGVRAGADAAHQKVVDAFRTAGGDELLRAVAGTK